MHYIILREYFCACCRRKALAELTYVGMIPDTFCDLTLLIPQPQTLHSSCRFQKFRLHAKENFRQIPRVFISRSNIDKIKSDRTSLIAQNALTTNYYHNDTALCS